MIKSEDLTFPKIKEKINKAGKLFYQYRACRRDAATIYDIENIRHGVVYARTPLQMNDSFDSMVGFSSEKIYDECIDLALDQAADFLDENLKLIFKSLLKYRLIGTALCLRWIPKRTLKVGKESKNTWRKKRCDMDV